MDATTILQFGIAAYIAYRLDNKFDAFIKEYKENNEVLFGLFKTLVGRVDRHDFRVRRIEKHLIDRMDAEEASQEEVEKPVETIGFKGVGSVEDNIEVNYAKNR